MIILNKIVSLEEFDSLRRDKSYTKFEIITHKNTNMRDLQVRCYLKFDSDQQKSTGFRSQLLKTLLTISRDEKQPNAVREAFGGYYSHALEHNGWMKERVFKKMLEDEIIFKLNLNIPKKFRKYNE